MGKRTLKHTFYLQWARLLWVGAMRRYRYEKPRVVAVGGSVGKTSSKEAVALLLEKCGELVVKTYGNMATDTGVPLSLLGILYPPIGLIGRLRAVGRSLFYKPQPTTKGASQKWYVLEYSSDAMGDTAFLTGYIPPDIAVLTTIVPVHMESYENEETMVKETVSLVDSIPEGGAVVANADDPHQVSALTSRESTWNLIWYGMENDNAVMAGTGVLAQDITPSTRGLTVRFTSYQNGRELGSFQFEAAVIAPYQLYPLLTAAAVALREGIPLEKVQEALESYELPAGRGRLIEGRDGVTFIDDSANASPEAVEAGLIALASYTKRYHKRPVAILGTMNELGKEAEGAHQKIGHCAGKTVDRFIAIGAYAGIMKEAASAAGLDPQQISCFATPEELLQSEDQLFESKDVVFVKASQNGMRLERVVKKYMLHPENASQLLVRQEAFWQQ